MKKIEATIRTSKFEEVKEALHKIGVDFFTFYDVKGVGRQKAAESAYRGTVYDSGSISRRNMSLVVPDDKVEDIISCIMSAARTGEVGDGKIFVSDIEKVVQIRTGDTGTAAL